MPTFNVGDCVWKRSVYGDMATVDIVDVATDDTGVTLYRYVQNGIESNGEPPEPWAFEPNRQIPYVYDPSHLKEPHDTKEKMWYGASLSYRAPQADDNAKRALWQAKIKKHEDAIVTLRQRCAPFKAGAAVVWHPWHCCFGHRPQNGCVGGDLLKGTVETEANQKFECTVKTADGVSHKITVWALGLVSA